MSMACFLATVVTVAILAQGTSWAVAITHAFLHVAHESESNILVESEEISSSCQCRNALGAYLD